MTMIGVYADWDGLPEPIRLGYLHGRRTRANEMFEADEIIDEFRGIVGQWRTIAAGLRLSAREQDRMSGAFRLAED